MSKRLLLADDSITIQKVIQITFAHEDYELTITDNGDAALAKALEIKPDLVMTDIYMPGMNGYELTTAIKQNPLFKTCRYCCWPALLSLLMKTKPEVVRLMPGLKNLLSHSA